jgi:hypothetical protein
MIGLTQTFWHDGLYCTWIELSTCCSDIHGSVTFIGVQMAINGLEHRMLLSYLSDPTIGDRLVEWGEPQGQEDMCWLFSLKSQTSSES